MSASEPTNDEVIRPPMAEEEFGGNKRDLIGCNAEHREQGGIPAN